MNNKLTRLVRCPTCKKSVEYSVKNKSRPFCSERCRLQDTAAWAEDKYAIPVEDLSDVDLDELGLEAFSSENDS